MSSINQTDQDHRAGDLAFSERFYRRLLRLYPAAVHRGFGRDMEDVFRDLRRAQRRDCGGMGAAVFAIRACAEIPLRALEAYREHWREARRTAEPPLESRRTNLREDIMGSLLHDLKFTFRILAKSPAFTVVAVLSLALGIGANTAIFSVLNAVFLRPLPYPEPDRLVLVAPDLVTAAGEPYPIGVWSYPYYEAFRQHQEVFEDAAAFTTSAVNLTGAETPDRVRVEYVASSYFSLLGVEPQLGRTFLPEETEEGGDGAVVLLQDGTWKRRFGADPGILGRTLHLNGVEVAVVGVLPPGFEGLSRGVELWLPFSTISQLVHPRRLAMKHGFWHNAIARLREGVTLQSARASFPSLAAAMTETLPLHSTDSDKTMTLDATTLAEAKIDEGIRKPLVLLLAAVSLVLLIACANVANLLLSRAVVRRREIGVRAALGAGRGRLVRQFLTESGVLALLGGVLGLLLAQLGIRGLKTALPRATPGTWTRYAEAVDGSAISIDTTVLLFTFGLALAAAFVFGLAPAFGPAREDVRGALAWRSPRPPLQGSLRRLNCVSLMPLRGNLRSLLIVTQMALALVLLVGAGLMIRSLRQMRQTDPGFESQGVLTARLALPRDPYLETAGPFLEQLLDRLERQPQVESVSLGISLPLLSNSSSTIMRIRGEDETAARQGIGYHVVGPDHLKTLGIPLVRGRTFRDSDHADAPIVVLVNQAAARRYWGDDDPIGQQIWLGMGFEKDQWAEIVGVVGDVRYGAIDEAVEPDAYVSVRQWPERYVYVLLRAAGGNSRERAAGGNSRERASGATNPLALGPDLRRELAALDANLPVHSIATLAAATAASRSHAHFLTLLLGAFATLAVVLAATGIYGVMAYAVSSRAQELGIRIALGAQRASILRLVLSEGLILSLVGAALGLLAAVYLTRFLTSQLYGVGATDPLTFAATTALLMLVALAATFRPASRAGRVDPIAVLRNE